MEPVQIELVTFLKIRSNPIWRSWFCFYLFWVILELFSASLQRVIARCNFSSMWYSADVASSADPKAVRLSTTVASSGGVWLSHRLYWETLVYSWKCTLYAYVSDNSWVLHSVLCSDTYWWDLGIIAELNCSAWPFLCGWYSMVVRLFP